MNNRAKYSAGVDHGGPDIIWVVDEQEDGAASVTNDAERVVAEVVRIHGNNPIVYRDSDGRWDGLLHEDGEFTGFQPMGADSRNRAVALMRSLVKNGAV
jgi:hypothetical protein